MVEIKLNRGLVALLDDEDLPLIQGIRWVALKGRHTFYAVGAGMLSCYMHRIIMDAPKGLVVDHINFNGLDNRRKNLRLATNAQNQWRNGPCKRTSGIPYKGVFKHKHGGFFATATFYGTKRRLGNYKSAKWAARAYDRFAKKYYGKVCYLNFPPNPEVTP